MCSKPSEGNIMKMNCLVGSDNLIHVLILGVRRACPWGDAFQQRFFYHIQYLHVELTLSTGNKSRLQQYTTLFLFFSQSLLSSQVDYSFDCISVGSWSPSMTSWSGSKFLSSMTRASKCITVLNAHLFFSTSFISFLKAILDLTIANNIFKNQLRCASRDFDHRVRNFTKIAAKYCEIAVTKKKLYRSILWMRKHL